jgi:hypothetical protein
MMRNAGMALVLFALPMAARAQDPIPIGIIDFYGSSKVPVERARAALTFREGDTISPEANEPPAFIAATETKLEALPGVARARVNLTCCDNGRAIAYVGIEESGSKTMTFREAPRGDARLAADVVQAGEEFSKAFTSAVERGDAVEDRSQGHALNHDAATRAVQDRFVTYANRDLAQLRRVLRSSSNAAERALAAQVLGYAADKPAIVDDLVYGMSDPSEAVRNNSMRALLVIAEMTPKAPRIPAEPFVALLSSLAWSDRNKAAGALDALTRRHPECLKTVRGRAVSTLAEMARWKSVGHAQPAFLVLARVAGISDEVALQALQRGDRETVIQAAIARGGHR